jgi:hypothetical protein
MLKVGSSSWRDLGSQSRHHLLAVLVVLLGVTTALSATTAELPDAVNGVAYSFQLHFLAMTPITATVPTDALPKGLSLNANGLISGTPEIDKDQDFNFTVTVIDSSQPPQTFNFDYHMRGRTAGGIANCWNAPKIAGSCGGPWLRTIVGFEQAGVSAAQSQQDFFFDLYYDRPLAFNNDADLGSRLRSWGNLRISSVPQQINTDVATFAAGFAQQVGQLKVNEVAQAFEFLGGLQYRLWASGRSPDYASSDPERDPNVHNRISANLILGGGVITPLSPKASVQIFAVPSNQPEFFTRYPQAVGKQFVAFTLPDRDRFFRQAYGGLRVMTHFVGDTKPRAPETFDLTYGFNESVTGGRIHGGVMRLEGFVPIPYAKMSWVYLFGTGLFKPGAHATIAHPFLLDAAPTGTLPTASSAVVISTPQADRDYYRVGVGIDLVNLIGGWKKSSGGAGTSASPTTTQAATPPATTPVPPATPPAAAPPPVVPAPTTTPAPVPPPPAAPVPPGQ